MGVPFTDYLCSNNSFFLFNFSNRKKGNKDETRKRMDQHSTLRNHDARSVCREYFPYLHRVEET